MVVVSWNIYRVMVMVFNATFNNISVISWWPVLSVDETEVLGENHRPAESHWPILSHNVVSSTPRLCEIRTHKMLVVIGIDCIGGCESNYHTIIYEYSQTCILRTSKGICKCPLYEQLPFIYRFILYSLVILCNCTYL